MRIEVALRRPACQDSVSGQHLAGPYYMVHGSRRGARASAVFGGLFALHQGGLLERNQPLSFHFTSSLHANCRAQTPKFLKHVTVAGFFESAVAVPFSNSSSSLPKPGLQPKRERDPNVVCFTAAATGERKPSVRKLVHFQAHRAVLPRLATDSPEHKFCAADRRLFAPSSPICLPKNRHRRRRGLAGLTVGP